MQFVPKKKKKIMRIYKKEKVLPPGTKHITYTPRLK